MKNEKLVNLTIVILSGVEGYIGDGSTSLTMIHINSDLQAQARRSKQG